MLYAAAWRRGSKSAKIQWESRLCNIDIDWSDDDFVDGERERIFVFLTEFDAEGINPSKQLRGIEFGRNTVEFIDSRWAHTEHIDHDRDPKSNDLVSGDGVSCSFKGKLQSIHEQAITSNLAQIPTKSMQRFCCGVNRGVIAQISGEGKRLEIKENTADSSDQDAHQSGCTEVNDRFRVLDIICWRCKVTRLQKIVVASVWPSSSVNSYWSPRAFCSRSSWMRNKSDMIAMIRLRMANTKSNRSCCDSCDMIERRQILISKLLYEFISQIWIMASSLQTQKAKLCAFIGNISNKQDLAVLIYCFDYFDLALPFVEALLWSCGVFF